MLDETYRAARAEYASTLLAVLVNIEDWLAVDSWLGGGKVSIQAPPLGLARICYL